MPLGLNAASHPSASKVRRAWRTWGVELALVLAIYSVAHFWNVRGSVTGAAPALAGIAVDGKPVALASFAGRPVLVNFWATWCGVCRAAEPNVVAVARDLPVLTVASSSGPPADVSRVLHERGLALSTLNDPDGALARAWGVTAFPTSFIVGPDGRIRFVEVGYTTALGLRARLWLAGL